MKKEKIYRKLKEFLLVLILSAIMAFLMGMDYSQEWQYMWKRFAITFIIWLVMWYGNSLVAHSLDRIYTFLKDPVKRFVLGVVGSGIYSGLAMLVLIWFFKFTINIEITNDISTTIFFTVLFSVLVFMVLLAREFLFSWRELALQEVQIKNELLASNFEALKNQVNPHFMFNSLNTLTSLIYQNQDLAAKYVGQLSKVYRSVLTANKNEVITIEEELKTLESYIFLQSIRFEDRFKVLIELEDEVKKKSIPPMVLQMLIENCIKHNEITEEKPLVIKIYQEEEMVCVKNTKALKQVLPGDKSSIGLANIKSRYEMLSDTPVEILDRDVEFIVKLPLLIVE